jgi:hypothetical protein
MILRSKKLMVWSAAGTLIGDSPPGNEFVSCPGYRTKQAPGLSVWLSQRMTRTHQHVAVVALANKLLRMAWAVLCKKRAVQSSDACHSSVSSKR